MRKPIIYVFFTLALILFCFHMESKAQQPYLSKLDSVGAAAVTGTTDSLATFRPAKQTVWLGITVTNSTTGDTLKGRAYWYGNTSAYKTVSWRNTNHGSIDSVLIISATAGLPQTWELVDPNIDDLQIYSSAGTYISNRKSKVFFRYRR